VFGFAHKAEARVAELHEKVASKTVITIADMVAALDEDREFARQNGHSAAAITASMGMCFGVDLQAV